MKNAVKLAFFISLITLTLFFSHSWATSFSSTWMDLSTTSISFMLQLDKYSLTFMTVALFVSWNIIEYSTWYMHHDPNMNTFMKYLLIFLMAMIILVSAGNLFTMFIGWEGVGIMSFLLISWYHGRGEAAISAFQAILYNRVGDIGFVAAFYWFLKNFSLTDLHTLFNPVNSTPTLILMAFIIAAATKSAQFGFHPWLAAAMEGPTPVSALLHSSTMVVAGIFLMIRLSPGIMTHHTTMNMCLYLGALSTLYASAAALVQNDIKKIIAYSTSSQLGLMMVAIGIGQPHLALFHICTHAFFKAMLFLSAGIFIHFHNDDQDIRKMGDLNLFLPITMTCFSIGSFALMGTPFLTAFYSKDTIIEFMCTSNMNLAAMLLTLMATAFTAIYSIRLIFYITINTTWTTNPMYFMYEYNIAPGLKSVVRLTIGSIVAGLMLFFTLIPYNPIHHTMPTYIKVAAMLTTALALFLAYGLTKMSWRGAQKTGGNPTDPDLFTQIVNRLFSHEFFLTIIHLITHTIEGFTLKKKASSLIDMQKLPLKKTKLSQSGLIKNYLATFLISISIIYTTLTLFNILQ